MQEIWKDIEGYEGKYQISNFGRVKSLVFRNNKYLIYREKILKPNIGKDGYVRIGLRDKNKKTKTYLVHRLVAQAFISDYNNSLVVNHKDENKSNNNVLNLEWTTIRENNQYSFNLHKDRIKAMQTQEVNKLRGYRKRKPVIQINKQNEIIARYDGIVSASKVTGFDKSTISNCCRGIYKFAYGYIWRYEQQKILLD